MIFCINLAEKLRVSVFAGEMDNLSTFYVIDCQKLAELMSCYLQDTMSLEKGDFVGSRDHLMTDLSVLCHPRQHKHTAIPTLETITV